MPCINGNNFICKKPAEHSFCKVEPSARSDCGWSGMQEYECRDFGCCWSPVPNDGDGHWCFQPENNVQCLNAGGTCVHSGQTSRCNRGVQTDLCSHGGTGGSDQVCCITCNTAECKQEEAEWSKYDTDCVMQGGSCQYNTMPCTQSGFAYRAEFSCGGPADRQCCAPSIKPTPPLTSDQTPPTVPPVFTSVAPPSGSSGGATAGIVIGVLIACCALFGGFFYVNQNGNPFIAAPSSFDNLNNDKNTSGQVDGISNPMSNDTGSDDGDTGGEITMVMENQDPPSIFDNAPIAPQPPAQAPVVSATPIDSFGDMFGGPIQPQPVDSTVISFDAPSDSLI